MVQMRGMLHTRCFAAMPAYAAMMLRPMMIFISMPPSRFASAFCHAFYFDDDAA